jgi:curved DNA-binding protein CbpA
MKISHREALKILGCNVDMSYEDIKLNYRLRCSQYHPDRNPAGLEMMKLINAAWEALRDYVPGDLRGDNDTEGEDYGPILFEALNAVMGLEGITIEICGSWIWISGDTRQHKEVLKAAGYRYAPKKVMWSFCGGKRTTSRGKFSMDDIRLRHGSEFVKDMKDSARDFRKRIPV